MPLFERFRLTVAALVCLTFVGSLRDSRSHRVAGRSDVPSVPESVTHRPGKVVVTVEDEAGAPLPFAQVRVLSVPDDRAYLAGAGRTDAEGHTVIAELPAGETWILAEGEGRARASTRLVLDAEPRVASLRLGVAATLRIAVVDDAAQPVPNPVVEIATGDPLPFVSRGDTGGQVAFSRLGAPPWNLSVRAAGFETTTESVPKAISDPVKVTLRRLGFIDVTAVDPEGQTLAGTTVLVAGPGLWPARRTQTDAAGRAKILDLPRGVYDFRAARGDLVSSGETSASLGRGESKSVTLTLVPGRRVAVRVTDGEDESARAVPQASLVLAEGGLSSFPIEGTTDEKGAASLGPIGPGETFVSAEAAGFVPRSGVVVPAGMQPQVRIALARGATLRGDVVDARGYPIGGASLEIIGNTPSGEPIDESPERIAFRAAHFSSAPTGPRELIASGELGVMRGPVPGIPRVGVIVHPKGPSVDPWVTRDDGTFRAFPVPPGRVRAIVRHPAYIEGISDVVTLVPAGEATVHVVLHNGGSLEGRVIDDHRLPVSGARVDVAATKGSLERTTFTAKDGSFALASLPPDIVLSLARPDAMDDVVLRTNVSVKEGERKEIELVLPEARGPVNVEIVDDRGGVVDGAQVAFLSLATDAPLRRTLFTDRDGHAIFRGAAGLAARISASRRGRAPKVVEIDAAPADIRIALGGGIRVAGTITTRGGRDRLAGAEITLLAATGPLRARSDRDGAFAIDDVPPGPARVSATLSGFARAERTVRVEAPPHEDRPLTLDPIDLTEGGVVEGDVVDAHGDPVAGARVATGGVPTTLPGAKIPSGVVLTNRRGEFKLDDLPEGDLTLEAQGPDVGRGRVTGVRVTHGRTTNHVRITLSASEGDPSPDPRPSAGVAREKPPRSTP